MSLFPLHGFALRPDDDESVVDALAAALDASAHHVSIAGCMTGGRWLDVALTETGLAEALAQPEALFGGLRFALGSRDGFSSLAYARDRSAPPRSYHSLQLQLASADCGLSEAQQALELYADLASAFGARLGGLFHPDQRAIALFEVQSAEDDGIIPPPGAVRAPTRAPEGIAAKDLAKLSAIVHPRDMDRTRAPETLWWATYLDHDLLRADPGARVERVNWHTRIDRPAGRLLVATARPPRLGDTEMLRRLASLAEELDLHGWQRTAADR